jgi:ABC-2 type transport system ATP-binding protein
MAMTADRIVVIGRGRLIAETTVDGLIAGTGTASLEDAYLELTRTSVEYRGTGQDRSIR